MTTGAIRAIRLGMIGTGGWGTRGHLTAYSASPYCDVSAACDVDEARLAAAAAEFSILRTYADYRTMLAQEPLDAVDISTPNNTHRDIALAAAECGINIICEKPLALSVAEAREMTAVAEKAGIKTAVNFTYRYVPAARFARDLILGGELGEIYHVIASYNQGRIVDPSIPHSWRLSKAIAGTGVLGDLGSHLIDLLRFWGVEITAVSGHLKTFVTERPKAGGGTAPVDVDDAASISLEFANGGTGVIFTSRFAFGRANHNRAEVYGSQGALVYDNDFPDRLQVCIGPFMGKQYHYSAMPIPRSIIHGAPTSTMQAFVEDIALGRQTTATFADGLAAQVVLDAVVESADSGRWVTIPRA